MYANFNDDREKRKKMRQFKKKRSTIFAITLLLIIGTVGIVNAQSQGFEVFMNGKSIGTVRSEKIFQSAVQSIEKEIQQNHGNDGVVIENNFELIQGRVDNPMDLEEWIQVLRGTALNLYGNGAEIYVNDISVGCVGSKDEAERILKVKNNLFPTISKINYIEKEVKLSETKDFAAIIESINKVN
ncbi:MAG: hypothetical protein ACRCU3_02495 [Eubacteriaceae bacterium]